MSSSGILSSFATLSSFAGISTSRFAKQESHKGIKKPPTGDSPDVEVFPFYWPKNRVGNEYPPIRGTPNRGPGTYNTHLRCSIAENLKEKPLSSKGYALGARTELRFNQIPNKTPSPVNYQNKWVKEKMPKQSVAPFGFSLPRKKKESWKDLVTPGPGTYEHQLNFNRRITWPMKFSSPDWSLVSSPKRRTLRIELPSDKDFRKQRNKMAYFSLYYK